MQYTMDLLINFIVFLTGSLFGSFYTLAIYRIPLKKNITRERSFCPNCKHKLGFFDLFPIFSYIFLRGKCRYCKNKIGSKYVFIELFTAAMFIMFFNSLKFFEVIELEVLMIKGFELFIFMLFFTFMFLIGFIDVEKYEIEDSLLRYGLLISIIYVFFSYLLHTDVNYVQMLISSILLILLYIIYEILRDYKIRTRYYIKFVMFLTILSIYIPIRIIFVVSIILIPAYILMYIIQKIKIKKENGDKDLESEENIQIKVEIEKNKNRIYTIEKQQIMENNKFKGKSLRLRDLRLKNINDEIHIPFALFIGLISFLIYLIIRII